MGMVETARDASDAHANDSRGLMRGSESPGMCSLSLSVYVCLCVCYEYELVCVCMCVCVFVCVL
jgi:hypothetical protein